MAISIGDVQFVYSGGASNTSQAQSLGGAISTSSANRVRSQNATTPVVVTGVAIVDAMGNAIGPGSLQYDFPTNTLMWKPNGVATFAGVELAGDGVYTIGTTSGYLVVLVTVSALPTTIRTETITIASAVNQTYDNVSALEALNGSVEYRCFYVKNTALSGTAYEVKLWIKTQPSGADVLALALDAAGTNGTAAVIADEVDSGGVLSALTFSEPATQNTGLSLGNLAPGEYRAFWVRRSVPAGTTLQVIENRSSIGISALL